MQRATLALVLLIATNSSNSTAAAPPDAAALLAAAKPGSVVVLPAGAYGTITLRNLRWAQPVTLDASKARFVRIMIQDVDGLHIRGGTFATPNDIVAVVVRQSKNVALNGLVITGARKGIVVDRSQGVDLIGNRLTGLRSDGINVALSRNVRIEKNSCRDFSPIPPVYDAAGKMVRDGDHPDCIQLWSRPSDPPTADVVITQNVMHGAMQGIFLGNHVRGGVDDGGFDRIVIRDNEVTVGFPNAIYVKDGRRVLIQNNRVRTVDGARFVKNGKPIRARIFAEGQALTQCGNAVFATGDRAEEVDLPC